VDVGDAPVGDPGLGAIQHPFVLGLVVDGPGAQRRDVRTGVRARRRRRRPTGSCRASEALGPPLHQLLGRAVAGDAGQAQRAAEDGQRDAGVTQDISSLAMGAGSPLSSRNAWEMKSNEYRPTRAASSMIATGSLPVRPTRARRADDVFGEVVHPFLDLQLILVENQARIQPSGLLRSSPLRALTDVGGKGQPQQLAVPTHGRHSSTGPLVTQ